MSTETLEQKLAELEERVGQLEAREPRSLPGGDWREVIGFAKDDDLFRDAMKLGADLREQANREGR